MNPVEISAEIRGKDINTALHPSEPRPTPPETLWEKTLTAVGYCLVFGLVLAIVSAVLSGLYYLLCLFF